jgi:hypothetical protein
MSLLWPRKTRSLVALSSLKASWVYSVNILLMNVHHTYNDLGVGVGALVGIEEGTETA